MWNFIDSFRQGGGANWTSLPQHFRNYGYFTTGVGKVYHPNKPPNFDQPYSWSEKWPGSFGGKCCGGSGCISPLDDVTRSWPPNGQASCEGLAKQTTFCEDDTIATTAVAMLKRAANGTLGTSPDQPWFIAVGFHQPHLPFYAHPADFALYPEPAPPTHPEVPDGSPILAWHSCLSNADGGLHGNGSNWGNFSDIPNQMQWKRPMPSYTTERLRRGYYASVTYADRNVGLVLDAAEKMKHSTAVALIGDHGWSLGEGNVFCKMTNYENGVRVPLIFRAPWVQTKPGGTKTTALAEAVDLYRTLADLAGVGSSVEPGVDGVSLLPVIRNPALPFDDEPRMFAGSVFPRCLVKSIVNGNSTGTVGGTLSSACYLTTVGTGRRVPLSRV